MASENCQGSSDGCDDNTKLNHVANSTMVCQNNENACRNSSDFATGNDFTYLQQKDSQARTIPQADCLSYIRKFYEKRGFSSNVVKIMLSLRSSSAKQYAVYIRKWDHFFAKRQRYPISVNERLVLDFLVKLFEDVEGYSAINTVRLALSTFFYGM